MPETGLDVWTRIWKQPAETFDVSMLEDIDTNISMMVSYFIDRYKAEGEDVRLAIEAYNRGSAIDGMQAYTLGVIDWMEGPDGQSMFDVMYKGSAKIFDAWIQAGYDKETDVRKMAAYVAKALSDNLMGQSHHQKAHWPVSIKARQTSWTLGWKGKDGLKDVCPN